MHLNPQQLEVANHRDGPLLVTAVPGSGKTASLTERIKNLVASGVPPERILAITFTNKAAKEMKTRIAQKVGDKAQRMTISTFHSMCAKIIRRHPAAVGLKKNFSIIDADDQKRLLESCVCKVRHFENKRDIPRDDYERILGYIERTRNACLADGAKDMLPEAWMYDVANAYYRSLEEANSVDFTGLLSETLRLFEKHPKILAQYQALWSYMSVDEVQDTNVAQYRIISMLASKHKNILLCGDLDQSIYKFRNASPENILQFEKDFDAKVLKLEKNYRSTPQILGPAQRLIEFNRLRKETALKTDNPSGPLPRIARSPNDFLMAAHIADYIERRILGGVNPSEVAILYRINVASRVLELALRAKGIKYKIIGDVSFYDRLEVKTSLSILRLLANEDDRIAFERCMDHCCRGVGAKTLARIADNAAAHKIPVLASAREFAAGGVAQARRMRSFLAILDDAKALPADEGLIHIVKQSGFWKALESKDSKADRCANVEELARDLGGFLRKSPRHNLSKYLQEVSLLSSSDEESSEDQVSLMTMHAAKGLEFDVVVISHAMQKIVPHERSLSDASEIEEERRLFYVAMTRARQHLLMACADIRGTGDRAIQMEPSEFLEQTGIRIPPPPSLY